MKITETILKDCYILEPAIFSDNRGYFFESFNEQVFNKLIGNQTPFVQDNQSYSTKGVLRGLHAQAGEHAQAKLVRVLSGTVIDVAVDARVDSPTFGQHIAIELSAENKRQLFVPRGFLHGFVALSNEVAFFYKCDNYYNKNAEYGVKFDDPFLGIDWQLTQEELLISDKDQVLPLFTELFMRKN